MDKQEIYWCPIGEMLDMLACLSIFEGGAKQKKKMTFDEVLKLE